MNRIYTGPGLLLAAAVALSAPAFGQQKLNTGTPDTETGLLLPAVQEVHQKPSGPSQTPAGHKNLKPGADTNPRGLLLPAIQKAQDAPQKPSEKPAGQTRVKPGQTGDPRGLLLPAVQKAHDRSPRPALPQSKADKDAQQEDKLRQFDLRKRHSDMQNTSSTRGNVQKQNHDTTSGVINKLD